MPITKFESLPDSARVWIYGAERDLDESETRVLLDTVDAFLGEWKAHGVPLTCARDWSFGRFLTVAVDQSHAGASGCSIDGLFRSLKSLEQQFGVGLVTTRLVFFRDQGDHVRSVTREEFAELGNRGAVNADTEVFDLSITSLGEWRARLPCRAADSWHSGLLPAGAR